MLKNIHEWCEAINAYEKRLDLPPVLIALLLDGANSTKERFVEAAQSKLNKVPKYLDVDFNPPVFPFDNRYFQDPYFLVEDCHDEAIDLENIRKLNSDEFDTYLGEVYDKFTYKSNGCVRIRRKELLEYAGKNYFFEVTSNSNKKTDKDGNANKKKVFIPKKLKSTVDIHIAKTMERALLRKTAFMSDNVVERTDIVNYNRVSKERTNILVAIDSSKSMETGTKLDHAKKAAISFHYHHSSYMPDSKIDFITFNDVITKIKPLDIFSLKPSGMTHTAELLNYAFNYFNRTNKNRSELYIITDGYPQQLGIGDTVYHGITLKIAGRLKALETKVKIIFIQTPWGEANENNKKYNKLICSMLSGELIEVEPEHLSDALITSSINPT